MPEIPGRGGFDRRKTHLPKNQGNRGGNSDSSDSGKDEFDLMVKKTFSEGIKEKFIEEMLPGKISKFFCFYM